MRLIQWPMNQNKRTGCDTEKNWKFSWWGGGDAQEPRFYPHMLFTVILTPGSLSWHNIHSHPYVPFIFIITYHVQSSSHFIYFCPHIPLTIILISHSFLFSHTIHSHPHVLFIVIITYHIHSSLHPVYCYPHIPIAIILTSLSFLFSQSFSHYI